MSRVLILILFMLWLYDPSQPPALEAAWLAIALFFGFYLLLVVGTGIWGRRLARRVAGWNFQHDLRRFNITMEIARIMIPIWFVAGLYFLGWRSGRQSAA